MLRQRARNSGVRDPRGFDLRVPVDAGRDRGKGDAAKPIRSRERDRILVAAGEQARFLAAVLPVDGTDRVDDMARGELAARRDHGLAGGQSLRLLRVANLPARREDLRATRAMDRAV